MPNKKVLIIGIDGGDINVFDRIGMGFLQKLRVSGIAGPIRNATSDDRGWATLLTGTDASWHGGFYWIPDRAQYAVSDSFTSQDYKSEPLWRTLSNAGLTQGYLGVPTTFPPQDIKGFFVSGGGGGKFPDLRDSVYPQSFLEENREMFEDYILDCRYRTYHDSAPSRLVNDLISATKKRTEVISGLITKYNPDLLMSVFVGPDRLQHYFWRIIFGKESERYKDLRNVIIEYYAALDRALCRLIDRFAGERNVLFVSDHGFSEYTHDLNMNLLLHDLGFAKIRRKTPLSAAASFLRKRLSRRVKHWIKSKNSVIRPRPGLKGIEWGSTQAFSNMARGVWLNTEGDYPSGVVKSHEYIQMREKIMAALTGCRNPLDGTPLFTRVINREEVYSGPLTGLAPDILIETRDCYKVTNDISLPGILTTAPAPEFGTSRLPAAMSGIHGAYGFFSAAGPDIKNSGGENAVYSAISFAPLVKKLLGIFDGDAGEFNGIIS